MFDPRHKMFLNIYRIVWHLLQWIFDVVDSVQRCGSFIKWNYKKFLRKLNHEDFSYEKELIEKNKPNLTKIPVHMAVILGTELPNFEALSKIIFWCLSAGIPNISFYDCQGLLFFFSRSFID